MDDLDALSKVLRLSRSLKHYEQTFPDMEARLREAYRSGNPWVRKAAASLTEAVRLRERQNADWYVEAFGLTATEGRIAAHLMSGGSIATYATTQGVSASTVRTQLKSIFAKVGVNRQAELLARLGRRQAAPFAGD